MPRKAKGGGQTAAESALKKVYFKEVSVSFVEKVNIASIRVLIHVGQGDSKTIYVRF